MVLPGPAVLGAAVGQNAQKLQITLLIEGQYPVIEHVGGHQRVLPVIHFSMCHLGVGVNESLLVDLAHTFDVAYVKVFCAAR